ncbi:SURF1 family protein [Methylobacterium radiodurans]|uniref:SURF1 family protein n=1 Tax=Methylobacterium radiodurans TaxID=2202828 RepID=UPI00248307B5|nr:SURF1 family protein [Methylobacterium radiodurans]
MTRRHPRLAGLILANLLAVLLCGALVALGTWQVHRRAWKLELIARVEANAHGDPVAAPGPADWPALSDRDAYRRVRLDGTWLDGPDTLVRAVTDLGGGFWVLTPLRTEDGFVVLVNRGFVPGDRRDPATRTGVGGTRAAVTGLLRLDEPGGAFLRKNDPGADTWYSRDVAAIARARGLAGPVAPYFVDAERRPGSDVDRDLGAGLPVGGLTVIRFHNNHLIYAITWYTLALMVAGGALYLDRDAWRRGRAA